MYLQSVAEYMHTVQKLLKDLNQKSLVQVLNSSKTIWAPY